MHSPRVQFGFVRGRRSVMAEKRFQMGGRAMEWRDLKIIPYR
jgi:hypothetical protein